MNLRIPFGIRLWTLIVALVLVAGGIVYALFTTLHRVQMLEKNLRGSQIESFRSADQIQRELLNLNNSMLRYALVRDPREWGNFQKVSDDLNQWIDAHDPVINTNSPLTTDAERNLLRKLNRAYDDYLFAANSVHSNAQPALLTAGQFKQLEAFDAQAERMRELARRLADAHRTAEEGFVASINSELSNLRASLTVSVMLLLAMVATMGWVIYRDMVAPLRSKLVRSQDLLERREKLATLGTLAAGIAHEIRNPLTSLKARLYTLEKRLHDVPAAKRDTEIIRAEISRLERIVQDVLSFARPADPKLETVSIHTLLREVHGLMSPSLESRGVQLALELGPELLFHADSGHLKQVLINLVRNGAEAIEGRGTVTLRAFSGQTKLQGKETETVILEVSDTGRGISPEAEKRLFDPFFSTKEAGTGLGLVTASRMIERHGGTLQYQTQPGRGTTFGVVLPRRMKDTAASESRAADTRI